VKLYAELADGRKGELKITADDVDQQIRQILGDVPGAAHRWIEAADGSWIQVSQIVRLLALEDAVPFAGAW
jgi:hypothetical protein